MKLKIISTVLVLSLLIGCKTNYNKIKDNEIDYIKVGDKNADYIPYYLKVYEADSLYLTNNFERSYQILDSLFKEYEPINTDTHREYGIYVFSAAMSGHTKDLKKKLEFGYENYGFLNPNHKDWKSISKKVHALANLSREEESALIEKYKSKLNIELRKCLVDMFESDQNVRLNRKGRAEMIKVDEINLRKMDSIIKIHGFPHKDIVGTNNAFEDYFLIESLILHFDNSTKDRFLPILLDNVKKGRCDPKVYATIYDRKMLDEMGYQFYGSFTCANNTICTLKEPRKIDSIRNTIGLPYISFYNWKYENHVKNKL